jgi:hypothetical protein
MCRSLVLQNFRSPWVLIIASCNDLRVAHYICFSNDASQWSAAECTPSHPAENLFSISLFISRSTTKQGLLLPAGKISHCLLTSSKPLSNKEVISRIHCGMDNVYFHIIVLSTVLNYPLHSSPPLSRIIKSSLYVWMWSTVLLDVFEFESPSHEFRNKNTIKISETKLQDLTKNLTSCSFLGTLNNC